MLANAQIMAVVPVTDLARAREFYENVLGLTVFHVDEMRHDVVYELGGTHLTVYERATATSGEHTALAFTIDGDIDAIFDGLLAKGVTFDTFDAPGVAWDERGVMKAGEMTGAWLKDPDGNIIGIGKNMF